MTSLGNIFTMEKALVHIIFGRYIFICEPISIILQHFLRILECKAMTRGGLAQWLGCRISNILFRRDGPCFSLKIYRLPTKNDATSLGVSRP